MKPQRGVGYDKDPYKPRAKARGATRCADSHLARRIGEALRDAYKGELKYRYSKGERLLRVSWMR